jgi:hypothetical protein
VSFHQGCYLRFPALPNDQVTLPTARNRPIFDLGRTLADVAIPAIPACFGHVEPRGTRRAQPVRMAGFSSVRSSPRPCKNNA